MRRLVLLSALLLSLGCTTLAKSPITTTNPEPAAPASPPDDKPTKCNGRNFPIITKSGVKPGSPNCCQLGKDTYHVAITQSGQAVAHRHLGRACSDAQENPNCIDTACYYGPCGGHTEPPSPWIGTTSEVFVPVSQPRVCGYQVKNGDQVIVSFPEAYSSQKLYPSMEAKCPYTRCLDGGKRGVTVTVTAKQLNATGRVESDPPGISLLGAGTASAPFAGQGDADDDDHPGQPHHDHEEIAALTATPTGDHARATFSGGSCDKTGDYGKAVTCKVRLAPDPQITVTYECQSGFTCE